MKLFKFLSCTCALIFLTSCNFTEEVFLEEDGSGKISLKFDGSQLMQTLEEAGAPSSEEFEKPIDSIISFKEFFDEKKDSIAQLPKEDREKLEKLKNFTMHMVMDPDEKLMKFDLFSDFKSVNDIGNVLNDFQNASALTSTQTVNGESKSAVKSKEPASEVVYSFSKNTFSRKVTITNQELFQKSLEESKQTESFLAGSTYTFRYHFPRKVKSTTAGEATFTADGKTMVYQVNFLDLIKDPESLSFEVELED